METEVQEVVQTTIEKALVEELEEYRDSLPEGERPRRSGYYPRDLDTEYGRIDDLSVPKLREGNEDRPWNILTRYQRSLASLFVLTSQMYVLGLSLPDIQIMMCMLLGQALSLNAINRVSLTAQSQMEVQRQAAIKKTPAYVIVDGVWVSIMYPTGEIKVDEAGHERECKEVKKRVVLVAMAVWEDGTRSIIHYEVAEGETQEGWEEMFKNMIERGLDPSKVKIVSSDGANGLAKVIEEYLPEGRQQRCITHKVRNIEQNLEYNDLETEDEEGKKLKETEAKERRRGEIVGDAYEVYEADTRKEAEKKLEEFEEKWKEKEPKAVKNFMRGREQTLEYYDEPKAMWKHIRTTNHLERFFRDFRQRSDEIGAFRNEACCLGIIFMLLRYQQAKHRR